MKTAVLLSGDPRFNLEFDIQAQNLINSEVDWYMVFWYKDYNFPEATPGSFWEYQRNTYSPLFKSPYDLARAREIIEPRLPKHHRLAHLEILDPAGFKPDYSRFKQLPEPDLPYPILCNWHLVKKCWEVMNSTGKEYQLVFRSRPDLAIYSRGPQGQSQPVDLQEVYQTLINTNNPNILISEIRNAMRALDVWAMGLPEAMSKYCSVVDYIEHFNVNLDFPFDPEQIVNEIWRRQFNLILPFGNVYCTLRTCGNNRPEDIGSYRWRPDFGSWV
jgi:hypothetical protein